MTNEAHLPDGTIIDSDTLEVLRTPSEAMKEAGKTYDHRITAARNFLATAPASDFTSLLADVIDVADDFMSTDLDGTLSKAAIDGGVYLAPDDFNRLCPTCLSRVKESLAQWAQSS